MKTIKKIIIDSCFECGRAEYYGCENIGGEIPPSCPLGGEDTMDEQLTISEWAFLRMQELSFFVSDFLGKDESNVNYKNTPEYWQEMFDDIKEECPICGRTDSHSHDFD